MNYCIINDFLSKDDCENLIIDSQKILDTANIANLNSRKSLRSNNLEIINLVNNSRNWKKFINKINSDDFFTFCMKKLNLDHKLFLKVNFVNNINNLDKFNHSFKILGNQKLSSVNTFALMKYMFFRFFLIFKKKLIFFKYKFKKILPIEFLYDYSQSSNGYGREIHRDSDSRAVVILIYLNELSSDASGGELNLYKFIDDKKKIPSRPDKKDCELVESVKPFPGKLIIFQNSSESLHSVTEMIGHEGLRHFIYGGFTLLDGKNPFLLRSLDKLNTPDDIFI